MKTILHIIDTTGPGGAETVFIDLATRFPRDKYRSIVVIRGKGWVYEELARRGMEPVFLNAKGSFNWRYLLGLIKLIRKERVDLIQSHLLGANVYCSLAGLFTKTPVIATFHGEVDIGERERLKWLKMNVINSGASKIIAVSEGLRKDMLRRTNLSNDKIEIIYNGIDTSAFQRPHSNLLKSKFGWPEEVFLIGSLGNIRKAKGYEYLLKAASLLEQDNTDYRFVIAGQPDKDGLYESLLSLQEKLGLVDKVKFLGFLDNSVDFLSNLDLFLSVSISEGLPLAAIQAMAAGLPVLATRCGGYEELITDKETGWLVDVANPEATVDAIKTLRTQPDIRMELGMRAKNHVQATFDSRIMYQRYENTYDKYLIHKN